MKQKTDEEILAIKRKLEAQGYTWETKTDEEWIANYRYHHVPLKELISRYVSKFKQWIMIHPRTTIFYILILILVWLLVPIGILGIDNSCKIMSGQMETTLTFAELEGFVFIFTSLGFLLLVTIFAHFFFDTSSIVTSSIVLEDEKAYKRKLRRKELATLQKEVA